MKIPICIRAAYLDDINACMRDVDGDGYGDSTDASISRAQTVMIAMQN